MKGLVVLFVVAILIVLALPVLGQTNSCWKEVVVEYSCYSGSVPGLFPGDRLVVRGRVEGGVSHVVIVDMMSDPPRSYVGVDEISAVIGGDIPENPNGEVWVEYNFPSDVGRRGKIALEVVGVKCFEDFSFLHGVGEPLSTPTPALTIVVPTPTLTPTPTPTLRLVLERFVRLPLILIP